MVAVVDGGAAGGDRKRHWQWGRRRWLCVFLLSPLYFSVFFSASFASPFSSLPPLLVFSFSSFLPSVFSSSFSAALPCIYRKTGEGETCWGGYCWPPPPLPSTDNNARQVGVYGGRLFAQKTGKKVGEKWRRKNLLLPCSLRVQGRRRWCRFKTAPFWVLFLKKNSAWNDVVFTKTHRFI